MSGEAVFAGLLHDQVTGVGHAACLAGVAMIVSYFHGGQSTESVLVASQEGADREHIGREVARKRLADAGARLRKFQAAISAGVDPAALVEVLRASGDQQHVRGSCPGSRWSGTSAGFDYANLPAVGADYVAQAIKSSAFTSSASWHIAHSEMHGRVETPYVELAGPRRSAVH